MANDPTAQPANPAPDEATEPKTPRTPEPKGVHDYTHPAEDCDEPACDHITRRTCEQAEKTIVFYRRIINGLRERLYAADPNAAKADWNRLMKALDLPDDANEDGRR